MTAKDEQKQTDNTQHADSQEEKIQDEPLQGAAFSESADSVDSAEEGAGAEGSDAVEADAEANEAADAADENSAEGASAEAEEWRRQLEEQQQRLLRLQADYDNFRRRTRQEKEELYKYAASDLLENLLPVIDNFDRALASAQGGNDYDALLKGIDMIYRQFKQILEQAGLSAMDAVGQPFNPEYHEAVMQVEDEDHEEGIVLEEMQKGYMFKDKVLRPAMVKVSG